MLRVMILGCGGIAPAHVEGFLKLPQQARITVLINRSAPRAQALNDRYQLGAVVDTDPAAHFGEVDIVAICTPPGTHKDFAVAALEAGCHVLLEKPMAPSLAECDAILDAASKSGKLVSVVAQSRFISGIRNAVDMVRSGAYGSVRYARANSVWYRGQSYYDLVWRGRWEVEGGGCTLNHSIHHIDLLLWAKGMPEKVRAMFTNLGHENSEEEDFSSSVLTYRDGSVAEITSTLVAHGEPQALSFQMVEGGIEIPFRAHASKVRENGFPEPDEAKKSAMEADFAARPQLTLENHDGQVENFVKAILGEEKLLVSGLDGRNCIELITGIYKAAITEQPVLFPIAKEDVFYGSQWRKTAPHFHEKTKEVEQFQDTTITNFKGKFS